MDRTRPKEARKTRAAAATKTTATATAISTVTRLRLGELVFALSRLRLHVHGFLVIIFAPNDFLLASRFLSPALRLRVSPRPRFNPTTEPMLRVIAAEGTRKKRLK